MISIKTGDGGFDLTCSSTQDLVSWHAAFWLSHWEKSHIEEIYTAHLIRTTINDSRNAPSTLTDGRLEGWVRAKVTRYHHTSVGKWKRLWMCISAGRVTSALRPEHNTWDSPYIAPKKRGISGLLSQDKSTVESIISLYDGQPGKYSRPVFRFKAVTQAFAVYPNEPDLISSRTLIKLQGTYREEGSIPTEDEEYESQMLLVPDLEGAGVQEMLRWLIGGHVAFSKPF
jgi:CCR4-NOT transcriptional complex subunit CAF120